MLVLTKLQSDIKKVFSDMKSAGKDAKDTDFSDGLSKACKDFIQSGKVVTADTGTVATGVFTGVGEGSVSVTQSDMSSLIVIAMNSMKTMIDGGDDVLAQAIFDGLSLMVTKGTVTTNITGATVPPAPATGTVAPFSGQGKGKMTCVEGSFVTDLKNIFKHMKDHANDDGFDGDIYLGDELGKLINTYIKSGTFTISGQGELSGVTNTSGSIS